MHEAALYRIHELLVQNPDCTNPDFPVLVRARQTEKDIAKQIMNLAQAEQDLARARRGDALNT